MLSSFVGSVDINAAFVLVTGFLSTAIVIVALIAKRRSRTDIANEFFLAKMKQEAEQARLQYDAETKRSYQFKQLEHGLITSHERQRQDG